LGWGIEQGAATGNEEVITGAAICLCLVGWKTQGFGAPGVCWGGWVIELICLLFSGRGTI